MDSAELRIPSPAALAANGSDGSPSPDELVDTFTRWAASRGLSLYPAQEEAVTAIALGSHVVLSTPTGSGKSLVAVAAHYIAASLGHRSYYTAPLKALVSEKFFDLVGIFGSANVGMVTGDSSVNADAPIICCTAEILANIALRTGEEAEIGQVVMDEFHFYADPQRGWAWQVPLLELPRTQFILMSATLGDVEFFEKDLAKRTGKDVETVTSAQRPVPLNFTYSLEPLPDLLTELLSTHRAPVYVVHFTQAAAVEQAQALLSVPVATREERNQIAAEIGSFKFGTGFGAMLSKLVRHGIGIHHAGMLPKYRRLVERLTQAGLLKVVCGTDTLGVGINVPIRTVVFTSLVKYDGVKMRHLTAREFHQIAGRAGRAGYDTVGDVIVQAPEHVIENAKSLAKAGDDERKRRKIVRKKAPDGAVNWTDKTFERLRDAQPESLTSQFSVTHAMALHVLSRAGDPVTAMYKLLTDNHEPDREQNPHLRRAVAIYRTLKAGGVVEHLSKPDLQGRRLRLTVDVPDHFALNQPLSPFAVAAMEVLDAEAPTFALDVVSVIEATLDDPRQVLYAQEKKARGVAIGVMKAEGYDYDERMEALEDISYPKPLEELLEATLAIYRREHPWVADYELSPKSVVRDMVERAMTFSEFISEYALARSEGVVLRYLTDAYRTLRQTVPEDARSEELTDIVEWLGEMVRGVDSSLLEEWEQLRDGTGEDGQEYVETRLGGDGEDRKISTNPRAFTVLIRNAMFRLVDMAARDDMDALAKLESETGWSREQWDDALEAYFDEYDDLGTGPEARSPAMLHIVQGEGTEAGIWSIRQVLDDPKGDRDWAITATVDLAKSDEAGKVAIQVEGMGPHQS